MEGRDPVVPGPSPFFVQKMIKRCLGQMIKGVQVVAATHDGLTRAYTSHWVTQVSFEEPVVMASLSKKHDTWPVLQESGAFTVSILAADQIAEGQYFSYPGHKLRYSAPEFLQEIEGHPVVPNCIAWFTCDVFDQISLIDHELVFGRITASGEGRLKAPPLLYSSRHGWRVTGDKAREPGVSIRDQLLSRIVDDTTTESAT